MNILLIVLEKLKLNTKLLLGFSAGLLTAAVIGLYSLSTLVTLEGEMANLYEKELLGISHIKEANLNLILMGRSMRQMLIAQDDLARDKARAQVAQARDALRGEITEARKRIFRPEAIHKLEEFNKNFNKYNENIEHAMALIEREKANPSAAARFITSNEFVAVGAQADDNLNDLTDIKERGALSTLESSHREVDRTREVTLLLMAVGLLLVILSSILIGNSIKRPNERLQVAVEGLAQGDVTSPIPQTDYPNEIGVMARAIQVLQGIYRKAEATHWIKGHTAEIAASLQHAPDSKSLVQTAISRLAPVIGARHGAVYVMDGEQRLSLLGSYGYRERKHLNSSFRVGEGLVGQCAMEKAPITLQATQDYIRINSGLGEGPPACVAVLPIIHQDRVLGVLEVASFQQFSERETALLDSLVPILATSMEIMDRNQRTRELLVSTQEQAERMEKQAAQLEEQTVEMEAQQAELLETENWFRSIIESAMDGIMVFDEAGRIMLVNPQAGEIFGYAPSELVGMNIETLVPESARSRHREQRQQFIEEGKNRNMADHRSIQSLRKDGGECTVCIALNVLPSRGNRGRCVSASIRKVAA